MIEFAILCMLFAIFLELGFVLHTLQEEIKYMNERRKDGLH